ncbi:MAG: membrane protein insertion efficiency factor YidD [bacterium]|jgi:putative membrane protein insertion efficiency factor|nr:membrane protein insertion efficiency factor YidD [bacterium]|tara:strand:- start:455 stop:691 length:237 start_codon:yes stop_codon:yes gene_type:complete
MKKFFELLFIIPIKIYQKTFSRVLPSTCRFTPSCSSYAIEAIKTHGPIKGLWLGGLRILRCNPFFESKVDKVPKGEKI